MAANLFYFEEQIHLLTQYLDFQCIFEFDDFYKPNSKLHKTAFLLVWIIQLFITYRISPIARPSKNPEKNPK